MSPAVDSQPGDVLVGVGIWPGSVATLRAAAGEAALRGCGLTVLHAVDGPGPTGRRVSGRQCAFEVAMQYAEIAHAEQPALRVTARGEQGPAWKALAEHRAQLRVVGRRGAAHATHGCTLENLVAATSAPTLVAEGADAVPLSQVVAVVDLDRCQEVAVVLKEAHAEAARRELPWHVRLLTRPSADGNARARLDRLLGDVGLDANEEPSPLRGTILSQRGAQQFTVIGRGRRGLPERVPVGLRFARFLHGPVLVVGSASHQAAA